MHAGFRKPSRGNGNTAPVASGGLKGTKTVDFIIHDFLFPSLRMHTRFICRLSKLVSLLEATIFILYVCCDRLAPLGII